MPNFRHFLFLVFFKWASAARFLAEKGIPTIISEPIGGNHHAKDEYVDIESLEKYFQILWDFIFAGDE